MVIQIMKHIEFFKKNILLKSESVKRIISTFLVVALLTSPVSAATLEGVLFSSLPSGKVQVNFKLTGQTTPPKVFSTQRPARIVFDFFDLDLTLEQTQYKVSEGAVDSINIVRVADRVRAVINLVQQVSFTSKFVDDQFVINVDGIPKRTAAIKAAEPKAFKSKEAIISNNEKVVGIDFRRTAKGGGSIMVDLSNPAIAIDLIDRGSEIVVDFQSSDLNSDLEKRLDVTDFATPVRAVDLFQNGKNVRLIIEPSGKYQHISFQKGSQFTVILDPITGKIEKEEEVDKSGYIGERLTLNFQRLEVRSALSVIADFTGLNIVASYLRNEGFSETRKGKCYLDCTSIKNC